MPSIKRGGGNLKNSKAKAKKVAATRPQPLFGGDCYDNAADKGAWMAETMSGKYDWHAPLTNTTPPPNTGSMCPVENGFHVATTEPIVDMYV